jgi:DNA-binding helix-hairpin-helix protein with protein kinase domain
MSSPSVVALWAHIPARPGALAAKPTWQRVEIGDQLTAGATGGTARVCKVLTASHAHLAAKLYEPAMLAGDAGAVLHDKLTYLVRFAPALTQGHRTQAGHIVPARPFVVWPDMLLYRQQEAKAEHFCGFLMRAVNGEMLTVLTSPRHRKQRFADYTPERLLQVAATLAEQLQALHGLENLGGILFGDLTPRNVMVTSDWKVHFIDADSFQYKGKQWCLTSKCTTPGFRSPRLATAFRGGKPLPEFTPHDDSYALGLILFHLLVDGAHPWRSADKVEINGTAPDEEDNMLAGRFPYADPGNLFPPKIRLQTYLKLPAEIRKAFELTFVERRGLAPGAWAVVLRRAATRTTGRIDPASLHPALHRSMDLLAA